MVSRKKGIGPIILAAVFGIAVAAAVIVSFLIAGTQNLARVVSDVSFSKSADQIDFLGTYLQGAITFSTYQGFFNVGEGGGYRWGAGYGGNPIIGNTPIWYDNSKKYYPSYDSYKWDINYSVNSYFSDYVNKLKNDPKYGLIRFTFDPNQINLNVNQKDFATIKVDYNGVPITYTKGANKFTFDKDFSMNILTPDLDKRYNINVNFVNNYVANSTESPNFENPTNRLHEKIKQCVYGSTTRSLPGSYDNGCSGCGSNQPTDSQKETLRLQDETDLSTCIKNAITTTEGSMNGDTESQSSTGNYKFDLMKDKKIISSSTLVSCSQSSCTQPSNPTCCGYTTNYFQGAVNTPNVNAWYWCEEPAGSGHADSTCTHGGWHPCEKVDGGVSSASDYCKSHGYNQGVYGGDPCNYGWSTSRHAWDGSGTFGAGTAVNQVYCGGSSTTCSSYSTQSTYSCTFTRNAEVRINVTSAKTDFDTTNKDQSYPVYSYEEGNTTFRNMYMRYHLYFKEPR